MAKNFVIVESPTKAKTIGRFLGKDYVIKASMGHLRDLPSSKIGVDTKKNFQPTYVIPPDKQKTVTELKKNLKGHPKVWIATDEDREGEAIGWHLLQILELKDKDYERIVFHEITPEAIKAALKSPRKIDKRLFYAQQARRILDRLVGYKLSPLLWQKIRRGLSAGRVQSVAVRLLVEKEREIQAFKPEEYWKIKGLFLNSGKEEFTAELERYKGKKWQATNRKEADRVLDVIGEIKNYLVQSVEKKETHRTPPPPFTTSTLQQEASRKLGFSVKQTMLIAQQLYEGIELTEGSTGLITYMRTDSFNLATSALEQAKEVIQKEFGEEFTLDTPRHYQTKSKGAQEAHEAIRPTNLGLKPEELKKHLDARQYKLYDLIWKRTLATQMREAVLDNTIVTLIPTDQPNYEFIARGQIIKKPGFMRVYVEDTDDPEKALEDQEKLLPSLAEQEKCTRKKLEPSQHFTQPPAHYTEASLVKKLEAEGIGRPSTYAPTISTIIAREYVEKKNMELNGPGKYLIPTEIGTVVTDFLVKNFPDILDYGFTAKIEEELDEIAEGKLVWTKSLHSFYDPFAAILEIKAKTLKKFEEVTAEKCEKCGAPMVIKFGRFGKFMACHKYPECDFTRPLPEEEKKEKTLAKKFKDEKCEKCGAPMVVKRGCFGEFLACSAYPECKSTKAIANNTGVKCPECSKGEIVERKSKKGRIFYGCNQYPKCKFALWNKPTGKTCPKCKALLVEAGKDKTKCSECDYKGDKS